MEDDVHSHLNLSPILLVRQRGTIRSVVLHGRPPVIPHVGHSRESCVRVPVTSDGGVSNGCHCEGGGNCDSRDGVLED